MSTTQKEGRSTNAGIVAAEDSRVATTVIAASNSLDPTIAPVTYRCTGVADQVQINASIVAAAAVGGGLIVLLEGQFNLAASIIGASAVSLLGMGVATILMAGAGIGHAISYTSVSNFSIGKMQVNTKTNASGGNCVDIDACISVLIFEVYIPDSDADGIETVTTSGVCERITICNCTILGADGYGISTDAVYSLVYGNQIDNIALGGIFFWGNATYSIAANNLLSNIDQNGITCQGVSQSVIGNILDTITHIGISQGMLVSGNIIFTATSYSISMGTNTDDACTGNIVDNGGSHGIHLNGKRTACTGNSVTGCSGAGIHTSTSYISIVGNSCAENLNGIYVYSGTVSVVGNTCYHNTDSGIYTTEWGGGSVISSNNCSYNDKDGIYVLDSNHANYRLFITGNMCHSNDDNDTGNYSGIRISNCDRVGILNNYLLNNGYVGIDISDATCDGTICKGNIFSGNISGPVDDQGTGSIFNSIPFQFIKELNGAYLTASPTGIEIDAATEAALLQGHIPLDTQQVMAIRIWAVALANPPAQGGQMHLNITFNAGTPNEAYNTASKSWNIAAHDGEEEDYVANDVVTWHVVDSDVGNELSALVAGDKFEVIALHAAAASPDGETDAVFGSMQIEYV